MTVIAFNIETIPDIEGGRRLYHLEGLSEKEVANVMFHKRRQESAEGESLRHHLHRIIAISLIHHDGERLEIQSLGAPDDEEGAMISAFFEAVERDTTELISWQGSRLQLPVLQHRALVHGVQAPRYWEAVQERRDGARHIDLSSALSGLGQAAQAPLDEVATLLGFPGGTLKNGRQIWDQYLDSDFEPIRHTCDRDALNTYLVHLRWQLIRGLLDRDGYERAHQQLRRRLESLGKPRFEAFLAAWQ